MNALDGIYRARANEVAYNYYADWSVEGRVLRWSATVQSRDSCFFLLGAEVRDTPVDCDLIVRARLHDEIEERARSAADPMVPPRHRRYTTPGVA